MAAIRWKRAAGPVVAAVMVGSAVVGIDRVNDDVDVARDPETAEISPAAPEPTAEPSSAGTAEPTPTAEPTTAQAASPMLQTRRVILRGTNRARAAEGKGPLRMNRKMNRVAQRWTKRMAATGTLSHNPVVGDQIPTGWSTWAENVAYGYGLTEVVRGWMDSPGHRENILRDVNRIGIGIAKTSTGTPYYTQVFAKY